MNKQELEARLKKADAELSAAVVVVARCAEELSDNAATNEFGFDVEIEAMVELRNALAHWKACTQEFLEAANEVGQRNYAKATERQPALDVEQCMTQLEESARRQTELIEELCRRIGKTP
jgi:hypothetical protein